MALHSALYYLISFKIAKEQTNKRMALETISIFGIVRDL